MEEHTKNIQFMVEWYPEIDFKLENVHMGISDKVQIVSDLHATAK